MQTVMDESLRTALFSCVLITLFLTSSAQTCSNYAFASNKIFSACNDLPYLNSFIHYTYDTSSGTLQIAYRRAQIDSSRWVAWGLNPTTQGMVGSQSIVAFQQSDGTMKVYTSPLTSYQTQLSEGELSFPVSDLSATYSNNEMIIFATLLLQNSSTTLNQVWQDGPLSSDTPGMHATTGNNIQSLGTLNVLSRISGNTGGGVGGNSKTRKRNIHGILNAISWGTLMPLGVLIARYMKVFGSADPAWFYLHVTCQTSAYIIGVAGWATGIRLGSQSPGITFTSHRTIGIALFCVATLQVIALLVRPKKDHKHRLYWNIYHHSVGYIVIILSIINIFKGFDILNPDKVWKKAYTGIIVVLGILAVLLEIVTWIIVLKRKKEATEEKTTTNGNNGNYGYNEYGGRVNQRV